ELVRDDQPKLGRGGASEERVEEDDAPRASETRDVGVLLPRPAARVGDEDVAHGDPGPIGEAREVGGERAVVERPEAVEDRLKDDGSNEADEEDEERGARRGGERPEVREGMR